MVSENRDHKFQVIRKLMPQNCTAWKPYRRYIRETWEFQRNNESITRKSRVSSGIQSAQKDAEGMKANEEWAGEWERSISRTKFIMLPWSHIRVFGARMMRRWWSAISLQLGRSVLDIPPPLFVASFPTPLAPGRVVYPFLLVHATLSPFWLTSSLTAASVDFSRLPRLIRFIYILVLTYSPNLVPSHLIATILHLSFGCSSGKLNLHEAS